MNILGVDYGTKRIGLAISLEGINLPLKTIPFEGYKNIIKNIIEEKNIERIVIGLPLSMSGRLSNTSLEAVSFAEKIKKLCNETYLIDERLTTSVVNIYTNINKTNKKNFKDQISAMEILKSFNEGKGKSFYVKEILKIEIKELEEYKNKKILIYNPPSYKIKNLDFYQSLSIYTDNPQIYKGFKTREFEVYNLNNDININEYDAIFSEERINEKTLCPWFNG